jgi:hypothetical protein
MTTTNYHSLQHQLERKHKRTFPDLGQALDYDRDNVVVETPRWAQKSIHFETLIDGEWKFSHYLIRRAENFLYGTAYEHWVHAKNLVAKYPEKFRINDLEAPAKGV